MRPSRVLEVMYTGLRSAACRLRYSRAVLEVSSKKRAFGTSP